MMKKISLLLLAVMFTSSPAYTAEEYDPQHTMLALNMAIVSVHRILATQDRLILDQEYQNIMNNLSLGNIRSDSDITKLYEKLMDIVLQKRLRDEEASQVQQRFNAQMSKRFTDALTDAAKNSMTALENAHKSPFALAVGLMRLIPACTASYFKYEAREKELRSELNEELYRLRREDMASFNDMQKQLLSSSWNLMNLYHLPDEFRLVQKAMDDFYRAVEEPDTASRRLRMLRALEDDFKVYPPYWYYRARTAQEAGDSDEANKSFDKFDEIWRPVLRRDPYKLEVTKYRISELIKDGVPEDEGERQKILALCSVMRDNTLREDWANNLFAAALFYALGEKEEAAKCVQINIDFGYEQEISIAMLSQIKHNVMPPVLAQDTLRAKRLNALTADMKDTDKDGALLVADYFDGRDGAEDTLKADNTSPLVMQALRLIELRKADTDAFRDIYGLTEKQIASKDIIAVPYSGALAMVKDYADNNNTPAQIFLADMYNYGWGVEKDINQAMKYYALAGEKKELYPQFMYINLMISLENYSSALKSSEPEQSEGDRKFALGMKYYDEGDFDKARTWFLDAAQNDSHAEAQYMMGVIFENGQGRERNLTAARVWYAEAAQHGHEGANKAIERLSSKSWWQF